MQWKFACDSDLHFDQTGSCRKPDSVKNIISKHKESPLDFVICPGDLTDTAADGCGCRCKKTISELNEFVDNYVSPLEGNGIPVKATIGNHDYSRTYPCNGVEKFIKRKYGATYSSDHGTSGYYTFGHNGVQFISLGVYPKNLKWLKSVLPADKKAPLIIYYHYNTLKSEPFGDWWKEEEKQAFYDVIKDYNILCIICGHWHTSCGTLWNNLKIIHCAGNPVIIEMVDQQIKQFVFM
jgi:Icc-related predicted phosphoesterase